MSNLPKFIFNFIEVTRTDIAKAGGKGGNLGEMAQLGVPIPPGFIISADAYYYFLDMSNLKDKIVDILAHTNIENNEEINKASSIIEELFLKSKIPPAIEHDIVKAYSKLSGFSDVFVAVRSSATSEDMTEASSAGQQRTFLNVKGRKELLLAVKATWASLFEPRAIYYRHTQGIETVNVGIAVPVQKMVQSEVSGIMFTLNPVTNDIKKITIEAVLGLGEAIVSGELIPDHYVLDKETLAIVEKNIAVQEWMLVRKPKAKSIEDLNQKVNVPKKWQGTQKIDDRSLVTLANIGRVIESHYGFPQDMEWAIEKGKLWIVQSRPVTTIKLTETDKVFEDKVSAEVKQAQDDQKKEIPDVFDQNQSIFINEEDVKSIETPIQEAPVAPEIPITQNVPPYVNNDVSTMIPNALEEATKNMTAILTGVPASVGVISGKVRIIIDPAHMDELQPGEVLVTDITHPNWAPIMKKASAIVTNMGGNTSHAAIVSRELKIPAIVGTQIATRILKTGEYITVDGGKGIVYENDEEPVNNPPTTVEIKPDQEILPENITEVPPVVIDNSDVKEGEELVESQNQLPTETAVNITQPVRKIKTATKVYVNMADPDLADELGQLDADGVGVLRSETMFTAFGEHPQKIIDEKREKEFVTYLSTGIEKVCKAFNGRSVIYRSNDFKAFELKGLKGGEMYEKYEDNPIIGYRGVYRYLLNPAPFKLELEALKNVRNKSNYKNLSILLPFVRTPSELREIKKIISASGLKRSSTFKIYLMLSIPSNIILIEDILNVGIDGVVFGTSDLSQLMLGLDKDNPLLSGGINQQDASLIWSYQKVIEACHKFKVTSSIDNVSISSNPDLVKELIKMGISSVSVNPELIQDTKEMIYEVEKQLVLSKLK